MHRRPRSLCIRLKTYLQSLKDPKVILSTLGFQLIWWQLLIFVSQGQAILGCLISLIYVVFHVALTARRRWKKELVFVVLFASLGFLGDLVLSLLHIHRFVVSPNVPFWMFCLWLNYMTSIHYSMVTIFNSRALTLFIGFIFGPWTYLSCWKIGLIEIPGNLLFYGFLQGMIWMGWAWAYRKMFFKKIWI